MSRFLILTLGVLVSPATGIADKPQDVPISKLGSGVRLIGELHEPLGTVMTIEGVIASSIHKEDDGIPMIRVRRINGRATQADLEIRAAKGWTEFETNPLKLEMDLSVELEGYETGEFTGVPANALEGVSLRPAVPGFHFRNEFIYHKCKKIKFGNWSPAEFVDRDALIEGRAISEDKRAYIAGEGWRLLVDASAPWPNGIAGKTVESLGQIRKADDKNTFRVENGTSRLVTLADQVGRKGMLRGRAWSNNDYWWLEYRGTDLYVEGMKELPGWRRGELHGHPVIIEGVLEEAILPPASRQSSERNPALVKQFIVRKPSWKPLDALLSPERGR